MYENGATQKYNGPDVTVIISLSHEKKTQRSSLFQISAVIDMNIDISSVLVLTF